MLWTGIRPSQMGRLQRQDFRRDELVPFVAMPRIKPGRLVAIPLVGDGLDAARGFLTIGAYGRCSCPGANKALERTARKAGRHAFTVCQFRPAVAPGSPDRIGLGGHPGPRTTAQREGC